jgi:hypothetical protein
LVSDIPRSLPLLFQSPQSSASAASLHRLHGGSAATDAMKLGPKGMLTSGVENPTLTSIRSRPPHAASQDEIIVPFALSQQRLRKAVQQLDPARGDVEMPAVRARLRAGDKRRQECMLGRGQANDGAQSQHRTTPSVLAIHDRNSGALPCDGPHAVGRRGNRLP